MPRMRLNMRLSPIAWVVRTRTDPAGLSAAIQEQLRQLTGLPVSQVQSMNDVVSVSTSRSRFNMLLMTIFGGSALVLAAIGIYGLMAYSVAQRRQEIGIRMALGAEFSAVRRMIMREGMTLALIGTVVGLGASFALARFIAGFLFQTDKWDPSVFAGVPVTLLLVALGVHLDARGAREPGRSGDCIESGIDFRAKGRGQRAREGRNFRTDEGGFDEPAICRPLRQ